MSDYDIAYMSAPLLKTPEENGDMGLFIVKGEKIYLALIDVLGHGNGAYLVAEKVRTFLESSFHEDLPLLMKEMHEHLRGSRGAVAALCVVDYKSGLMSYTGIGNIAVKIMGPRPFSFVPRDGIVGYMIPTPNELNHKLVHGDVLVMYSDGIKEHFDPLECVNLLDGNAESICSQLIHQFGKQDDDASCLVLKMIM